MSSMFGGGSASNQPTTDQIASAKRASLVREQWADSQARFQPVQNQILSQMDGLGDHTTFNNAGIAQARTIADTAYNNAEAGQNLDRQRLGQGLNSLQTQALQTNNDIKRAQGTATAVNTASQADIDRKYATIGAGLGAVSAGVQ